MNKYEYNNEENERLTEVSVEKVWLKEDLLPRNSAFRSRFPEFWNAIDNEVNLNERGFIIELDNIKRCINISEDLFIIIITTESKPSDTSLTIGQRAYLSNKTIFIDITWLMMVTNLFGCRYQRLHPPHEDFIAEFIGEKYF